MRRSQVLIAFASVLAVAGCNEQTAAPPDATVTDYPANWSPDGTKLAFSSDRAGNWEIYIVDAAGGEPERVTFDDATDGNPHWSPDGKRLAFDRRAEQRDIFIVDLETREERRVTDTPESDEYPMWTTDGESLVHFVRAAEKYELRALTLGTGESRAFAGPFDDDGRPSWSADGDSLAFIGIRNGERKLLVVSLGGAVAEYGVPFAFAGNASLAPDGASIAFDAHADGSEESGDGKWEVWSMALGDSSVARLTDNSVDDWAPRYSPDGTRLAFLGGGRDNAGYRLFIRDMETGETRQLTFDPK